MRAKIVGLGEVIQGTSKKTGREYFGQSAHLTLQKPGVTGVAVMEQFLSYLELDQPPKLAVGADLLLDFDQTGRLLAFAVAPPEK